MRLATISIACVAMLTPNGWAAHCTTTLNERALVEYHNYVRDAEPRMQSRFVQGHLSSATDMERVRLLTAFQKGTPVRWNMNPEGVNQGLAEWNGTVIDWVGAVRIRGTSVAEFRAVLEDYGRYAEIYRPMVYDTHAHRVNTASPAVYEVTYGYQNTYRAASVFPQHYSFEVKARTEYSEDSGGPAPVLTVHSQSSEIRESDSGVPGRDDFLEPYHDHGIMWALNTYWRTRAEGPDLYVEFEAIMLARSVQDFACKIGIFPVPKYLVTRVMDSLPGESLDVMMAGTKAECERRRAGRPRP